MKKKINLIIISALIIVIGLYVYNALKEKSELEMDTVSYLKNRGYDIETDIKNISIVNMGEKDPIFAAVVTFTDEPLVAYFYTYKDNSKEIQQIDVSNQGANKLLKHAE